MTDFAAFRSRPRNPNIHRSRLHASDPDRSLVKIPLDDNKGLLQVSPVRRQSRRPYFGSTSMSSLPPPVPAPDRYIVIHVATTCDEHGVYVTKDSAEVIEIGWILVDAKTFEEVGFLIPSFCWRPKTKLTCCSASTSYTTRASWSSPSTLP